MTIPRLSLSSYLLEETVKISNLNLITHIIVSTKLNMDDEHCHSDGWTPDEILKSMRSNCEAYKKKDMELIKVKEDLEIHKSNTNKLNSVKKEAIFLYNFTVAFFSPISSGFN